MGHSGSISGGPGRLARSPPLRRFAFPQEFKTRGREKSFRTPFPATPFGSFTTPGAARPAERAASRPRFLFSPQLPASHGAEPATGPGLGTGGFPAGQLRGGEARQRRVSGARFGARSLRSHKLRQTSLPCAAALHVEAGRFDGDFAFGPRPRIGPSAAGSFFPGGGIPVAGMVTRGLSTYSADRAAAYGRFLRGQRRPVSKLNFDGSFRRRLRRFSGRAWSTRPRPGGRQWRRTLGNSKNRILVAGVRRRPPSTPGTEPSAVDNRSP